MDRIKAILFVLMVNIFVLQITLAGVFETTRSSSGIVSVDLTPQDFANDKLTFKMKVTTHSVNNLNTIDLSKIVTLYAGDKKFHPIEVPQLMGHHSSGLLIFKIEKQPEIFRIRIEGLSQPASREFVWP